MHKILIAEDDAHIGELLTLHLAENNCLVILETDGAKAYDRALKEHFDLLILDIGLPKVNGLDICRAVRKYRKYVPILLLTARAEEEDKVLGLEIGADDYMTKPFSVKELMARIKAIVRRTQAATLEMQKNGKILDFRNLIINTEERMVSLDGERIELTPKEFDLLVYLARKPGRSYSRQQLLDGVWGYEFEGLEHTVNSHINRLRMKIEPNLAEPTYILTTWGVGYRFNDLL